MGFPTALQHSIYKVLLAVLELGQLSFCDANYEESNGKEPCTVVTGDIMLVERLLSVTDLEFSLSTRRVTVLKDTKD